MRKIGRDIASLAERVGARQINLNSVPTSYRDAFGATSDEQSEILEAFVDRGDPGEECGESGFSGVINQLGNIASEKAEHLRENWQDDKMSAFYSDLAEKLWRMAGEIGDV